jgi:hypothetical protein
MDWKFTVEMIALAALVLLALEIIVRVRNAQQLLMILIKNAR